MYYRIFWKTTGIKFNLTIENEFGYKRLHDLMINKTIELYVSIRLKSYAESSTLKLVHKNSISIK